jgi:CheY-like chemotaxis protein
MADQNIDDHVLVKKAARECGINHVFTSVYNGVQLMNLLLKKEVYYSNKSENPDLIIMDFDLPLLSGLDALTQIKLEPQLRNIPVYFLTRGEPKVEELHLIEMGATGLFIKPSNYKDLQKIVASICNLHLHAAKTQ